MNDVKVSPELTTRDDGRYLVAEVHDLGFGTTLETLLDEVEVAALRDACDRFLRRRGL